MNWLFTILVSLTPFYWYRGELQNQFFGYGDFLSPINALQEILNRLFMFYPHVGAGSNIAFLTPHIFPFLSWYATVYLFHISPFVASLGILSIILFCAQISMEAWMNYILLSKWRIQSRHLWFFCFIAGKLYGLAPLFIWLIAPGHIYQLIAIALLPWILLYIDKLLTNDSSRRVILPRLFFLFICCSPAFANIGILYVFFVIFFLYSGAYWVTRQSTLWHAITVFVLVIGCAVFANIWWFLPYLATINETIRINLESNIISANISGSVGAAYLLNIFLGHPELLIYLNPKYNIYLSYFFEIGTIALTASLFLFLRQWKRHRYTVICFIMLLSAMYLIKGDQQPFPGFFVWLYAHFPGFQIFRRPVSKYYFVYWFFLLTLSISYYSFLYQRLKKYRKVLSMSIILFLCIFTSGVVYAFVTTKEGNSFSIPRYYYDASTYLQNNNATRVLLLPGIFGSIPAFNSPWIQYAGTDFFPAISNSEFIIPDETNYSAEVLSKPTANKIVSQIRNGQSFCETVAALGITHIVLRRDLSSELVKEDDSEVLQQQLLKSGDVQNNTVFNPSSSSLGLSIFTIQPKCLRSLVQVSSGVVTSQTIYPGLVVVHINGLVSRELIAYLYNYSDQWSAYKDTQLSSLPPYLRAAGLISKDVVNALFYRPTITLPHLLVNGYANGWRVDGEKSTQVNIILVYRPQYVFYFGIVLFIATITGWIFIFKK